MNSNIKSQKRGIINIIFLIFMVAATMYFILKDNEILPLINVMKQVNLGFVVVAVFMMLIYIFCESVNTYFVMNVLECNISLLKCIKYIFVNIYFCSITPSASGGQPFQIFYMQRDNINVSYSSLTVLIVAAIYKLVLLCYVAFILFFNRTLTMQSIGSLKILLIYGIIVNAVLILINIITIFNKKLVSTAVYYISSIMKRLRIVKKADSFIEKANILIDEYVEGGKIVKKNPYLIIKVFIFTFLQITAMFMVPYCIYKAFGLSGIGIIYMISLQAILTISVSSLPLPGAVGPTESGFLVMFKSIFGGKLIIPAMLLSRGISFYLLLVTSGIITFLMNFKTKCQTIDK